MSKPIPSIYKRLGVRPVIHGSGTTTRYGGSLLRPEVLETMREASGALVNLDELNEAAGDAIARMLGAEAAFVTAGASAGLILQAAACIAGGMVAVTPGPVARPVPVPDGLAFVAVIPEVRTSTDAARRALPGEVSLGDAATTLANAVGLTLALAALDIVALPDRMVEAVIALSIAVVAAENLFLTPVVARRWLVSFAFGLVHGFGFSSVLRGLGLATHGLLVSLLGFNIGVELGQMAVVAVALPALLLVRTTRWRQRVVWGSSAAVLLVGVVLFSSALSGD